VPRNLGTFTGQLELVFERGILRRTLALVGKAAAVGEKGRITRGDTALPIDFQPTVTVKKFGKTTTSKSLTLPKFEKLDGLSKTGLIRLEGITDDSLEARYTYPAAEFQARMDMKNAADGFLQGCYKGRALKQARNRARVEMMDETACGMGFGSGLRSPRYIAEHMHIPCACSCACMPVPVHV
jgi:hypothetical protein